MTVIILNRTNKKISLIEIPKHRDIELYLTSIGYDIDKIDYMEVQIHQITLALEEYFSRREK